jgi:asparagine synthase (glutamine-hydrolysing)
MSAIFGLVAWNHLSVTRDNLVRMSNVLAHHGSDGGGIWADGPAGLGQRLMRFTPQDSFERQPLIGADAQRVLVSDARIDNRRELMPELDIPPAQARQLHDSAFVLRAYEKWGENCPQHLIGAFAYAVWDTRLQRLFVARSRTTRRDGRPSAASGALEYKAGSAISRLV